MLALNPCYSLGPNSEHSGKYLIFSFQNYGRGIPLCRKRKKPPKNINRKRCIFSTQELIID